MTNEKSDQERSFKVQDRRRFSESGEARTGVAEGPEPSAEPKAAAAANAEEPPRAGESVPEINFSTFVLSLSTQALAHLGEIPHPMDGNTSVDLTAARQVIDILGMLRERTKGNLDKAEETLLQHILYDLRMKYVEKVRSR